MNVLLIGSGGREHALAYKIAQSKNLDKLFIIPGNPGTENLGINIDIDSGNFEKIYSFCSDEKIDLVVIGPEQPLVDGMADFLRDKNIKVFGPGKLAAEIESRKSFAKSLMSKYSIPTAAYAEFNSDEYDRAVTYIKEQNYPLVIKADGLAAGKGVLICANVDQAIKAVDEIFVEKVFGRSGDKIIVEEFLYGEEASIFAITDGKDYICLPSAQDHKRIGDGDTGKNTGGMGAYSPAPIVTSKLLSKIEQNIILPAIKGLQKEGREFIGCLYCGLMILGDEVKVVEFNCRFGDPETQSVLPLLKGDFLKLLYSASSGKIDKKAVSFEGGTSVCVVAASKGYPDKFEKGFKISGLENVEKGIVVFHAGTKRSGEDIVTNGGRVLGVTSFTGDNDLKRTKARAYNALGKITFNGIYFRKDIADKAINKL